MSRTSYELAPVLELLAAESWTVTRGAMIEARTGKPTDHGLAFCERIGLDPRRLSSVLLPGRPDLTFWEADEVGQHLARHPATMWPEWTHDSAGFDD